MKGMGPKKNSFFSRTIPQWNSLLPQWSLFRLGPINTRTGNYSAKYLFYRYDDIVAMILPVTGFRLECAKINRVESDNYPQ